jgi:hypothetical protein
MEPRRGDTLATEYAWTAAIATDRAGLAAAIRLVEESARTAQTYISLGSMLAAARKSVPARVRTGHLDAIVALGVEHRRGGVARALTETLGSWDSPAVSAWCGTVLPGLVRDWLPALSPGLPYGEDEITPLLNRTGMDRDARRELLLGAVQAHVDALGPESLLGHVGLIADLLPAPSVASLLEWYVERLASRVLDGDLERVAPGVIPEDEAGAVPSRRWWEIGVA